MLSDYKRGRFNMPCWNSLGKDQQEQLIRTGTLEFGWEPNGTGYCHRGAEIWMETYKDAAPGPRFYCLNCAIVRLLEMKGDQMKEDKDERGDT